MPARAAAPIRQSLVVHRMPLAEAEHGYKVFNKKEEECRKVVLPP
jgi:S-(hydroxymethyl)glutathione dehydrogenase / alcohol dehydrogenase